ncbi:MAG: pitrilysin family protein, partial [bacterium]
LGFPIAGRIESVSSLDREGLLTFIRDVYRHSGIVIACAGNVDHQGLVSSIAETFQETFIPDKIIPADASRYHPGTCVMTKDLEQVHLCLSLPGISQNHPDRYAFYLLSNILGGNMSSRLFQEVRERRGLAYSVYSYLSSYKDSGAMTLYAGAGREKIKEVIEVIQKELHSLANQAVSEQELSNVKEYMKGGLLLGLESSAGNMSRIAKEELNHEQHQSIDEIIQKIEQVSSEKILEIAAANFRPEQMSLAAIGPVEEKELIL